MAMDHAWKSRLLSFVPAITLSLLVSSTPALPSFYAPCRADEPPTAIDADRLKRHYLGLSAEDWKQREEHSSALIALGKAVIEPLQSLASRSDDPEVLLRVRAIVEFIARREWEAIVARRAAAVAKVGKGYIGINISNGRTAGGDAGIEITSLIAGLPGEACGLRQGDIVIFADEVRVSDTSELIAVVSAIPAGERVKVVVQRGAARLTFEPELAARPQEPIAPKPIDPE